MWMKKLWYESMLSKSSLNKIPLERDALNEKFQTSPRSPFIEWKGNIEWK